MILDDLARFCGASGQNLSGTAVQVSTDYYNAGAPIRFSEFRLSTFVSAKAGTSPDLKVEVYGGNAASAGVPTWADEKQIAARTIAAADLVAGKVYHLDIPPTPAFQFLRVKFTQSGNADNTASVQAYLVPEKFVQTDVLLAGVGVP